MKFCVTDSDKKTTHITYLTKAATTDFYKTSLFFLTCLEIKKKKNKKKSPQITNHQTNVHFGYNLRFSLRLEMKTFISFRHFNVKFQLTKCHCIFSKFQSKHLNYCCTSNARLELSSWVMVQCLIKFDVPKELIIQTANLVSSCCPPLFQLPYCH